MILSAWIIVPKMAGEEGAVETDEIRHKYKEIDWWGQFLSICGLVLLSFSLTYVPCFCALMIDTQLKPQKDGKLGI